MKRVFLLMLVGLISLVSYGQIIINHTHVDMYDDIPQRYIDSAKTKFVSIAGRSHASAIYYGLNSLEGEDSKFQFNESSSGPPETYTAAHLRAGSVTYGNIGVPGTWQYASYYPEDYFTSEATSISITETSLDYFHNNGYDLDYFGLGWSWDGVSITGPQGISDPVYYTQWDGECINCTDGNGDIPWGLDSGDSILTGNRIDMDDYLAATETYRAYCEANSYPTNVIFATGPIDNELDFAIGETGYQASLKWQHIRNYVINSGDSDFILYDFADILAYNDLNEEQTTTWTNDNSELVEFQICHDDNYNGAYIGHIGAVGALRLGKAVWVMLAIDAGWNPNAISDVTNWYVSNNGNDTYSGHHPDSAIATIAELNTKTLNPNDTVFFEKGGIWREEIEVVSSGTAGNLIVYTSYGNGNKPKIWGSENLTGWSVYSGNVYSIIDENLVAPVGRNNAEGILAGVDGNDSITHFNERQGSLGAVDADGEWYYDDGTTTVYFYSTTAPDSRFTNGLEIEQRNTCMTMNNSDEQNYICVDGVELRLAINAGFSGGYPGIGGSGGLVFRNNTIGYIGVKASGYGYGIEAYHDSSLYENNYFSDCGRRSISINTYVTQNAGEEIVIKNLIVRNNTFKRGYHTSSLDCSTQLSASDTVDGVYFYGNIVDDSELTDFSTAERTNQIFVQLGSGVSYMNNFYIFNNSFIHATARNILLEGVDTSYVFNNTIIGHNQWMSTAGYSPFANVSYNLDGDNAYYANNILYDNLGQVPLDNHGVFMYANATPTNLTGVFELKDYNLYYSEYPGYDNDRNFSGHRPNSQGITDGFWATDEWSSYLSDNSIAGFEANSPVPQDPYFKDYDNRNYRLTDSSAAVASGEFQGWIIVTDVEGKVDTANKYDIDGNEYSTASWDLGAYAYSEVAVDSTATDIITFTITNQVSSVAMSADSSVVVTMPYGTDVTDLAPTITLSPLATVSPLSGVSEDFTGEVAYTVTANKGNTQEWGCSVTVQAAPPPSPPSSYNVERIKFGGKRRVINGKPVVFNK